MKGIIDYISSETGIRDRVLLEKDLILHGLLVALSDDEYFSNKFVFKGGTCITKCYYGYYRFSEDLDFSWADQRAFKDKSQKEIRRLLSKKVDRLIIIISSIAKINNLDFKVSKADKRYLEIGGSNKFTTFKLWYRSAVLDTEQFIKIQINFVERFYYGFQSREAKPLMKKINQKDFQFLFPDKSRQISINPKITCYDIREILIEKVRAIMTRRAVKARDFIDVYMIKTNEKLNIEKYEAKILDKIMFMLQYDKYVKNLKNFKFEKFVIEEEDKLLLEPIGNDFEKFLKYFHGFLNNLYEELIGKI